MPIVLKEHQKSAVEIAKQTQFGTITDTCGAGKSYEECELIFDAFDRGANVVCYGAHRLDLILQQKNSLLKYGKDRHNKYIYNDERKDFIILEVSSANREHGTTTTILEIAEAIKAARISDQKLLIYFCFASAERLYQALQQQSKKADLLICDEAHFGNMSVNDSDAAFNRHLFRNVTERMYFFTATPTDLTLKYQGIELMPIIHEYKYGDALKDGIVLPFTAHWLIDESIPD